MIGSCMLRVNDSQEWETMKKINIIIKNNFKNLSLKSKLIICFLSLVTISVCVSTLQSYRLSGSMLEKKTKEYMHDIFRQTITNIEYDLQKIEDITFNIVGNVELQQLLYDAITNPGSSYEQLQRKKVIENMLSSYIMTYDEVVSVYIVADNNVVFEHNKERQFHDLKMQYKRFVYKWKGSIYWHTTNKDNGIITANCAINNLKTQKPMGYIIINIKEQYIYDKFKDLMYVEAGDVFLINSESKIVSHSNKDMLGKHVDHIDTMGAFDTSTTGFFTEVIDGEEMYISNSDPLSNGWCLVSITPSSYYQNEIIDLRNTILMTALVICCIGIALSLLLAKNLSGPLIVLSDALATFGKGDFSVSCNIDSNDEVGKLSRNFNRMVTDINQLIETVFKERILKQEAELKSLQMQINPHFLYNTLETINWTAREKGVREIGEMAKSLGDLMRGTISGKDFILLSQEEEALKNYLKIQKFRFEEKLNFIIDIPTEFHKYMIPKFIIQPLLENAIVHGIEPKLDPGTVEVHVCGQDGDLMIWVIDDGVGVDRESIQRILSEEEDVEIEGHTLIGINNVNRRIQIYYGKEYGLQIKNNQGKGTRVFLRLKAMEQPPNETDSKMK